MRKFYHEPIGSAVPALTCDDAEDRYPVAGASTLVYIRIMHRSK